MATRQRRAREDEYLKSPQAMIDCVLVTLSDLPPEMYGVALRKSAETYRRIYEGLPTPEWIDLLAELADRHAGN